MARRKKIVVLEFGGCSGLKIVHGLRLWGVYSELHSGNLDAEEVEAMDPDGIIIAGDEKASHNSQIPVLNREFLELKIPILGVGVGASILIKALDEDLDYPSMKHGMVKMGQREVYALQIPPSAMTAEEWAPYLGNFAKMVCDCRKSWRMEMFLCDALEDLRDRGEGGKAVCVLDGSNASAVAAALAAKIFENRLTCIFVDHGLFLDGTKERLERTFGPRRQTEVSLISVDGTERISRKLAGIRQMEEKRAVIKREMRDIVMEELEKMEFDYIIYPIIYREAAAERAFMTGETQNFVYQLADEEREKMIYCLPDGRKAEVLEPIKMLFDDEVYRLGEILGLINGALTKNPMPKEGLAARIIGEVTPEKLRMLKEADRIYKEEVLKDNLWQYPDMYFAVLTDLQTVGLLGENRTYGYAVVLRAVYTEDFSIASVARLSTEKLCRTAERIIGEVEGVNRVFYDYSGKPSACIELQG